MTLLGAGVAVLRTPHVLVVTASPVGADPSDLDPTFGGDGKVTTDFGSDADWAYATAIQGDGKICPPESAQVI
jgi:hypothetical protein